MADPSFLRHEDGNSAILDGNLQVLLYEDTALRDVQSGELVEEDAVDWDTEDQPEATPAEGLRHANTVAETTVFAPEYFCLGYRAAGLTVDAWFARNAGMVDIDTDPASVDLDDDAREAARQKAQAERAEAEKRERRRVLALNKLGDAAMSDDEECTSGFRKEASGSPRPRQKGRPFSLPAFWLAIATC